MRVKIASSGPMLRAPRPARTSPQYASSAISAACRMYVDLPPMLGPVTSSRRRVGRQREVVGDEVLDLSLDHRMAAAADRDAGLRDEDAAA